MKIYMTVQEARQILQRPVFGDRECIKAREVLELAAAVGKLHRAVPLVVDEMDEGQLLGELEATEFRARMRR